MVDDQALVAVGHLSTDVEAPGVGKGLDDDVEEDVAQRGIGGRGGSSLNYGPGSHTDWPWIDAAAANLTTARLTTLLLPGVGTIEELEQAFDLGMRSVRVATHCTGADVSAQHIAAAREIGMDVSGFLMMSLTACRASPGRRTRKGKGEDCVVLERGERTSRPGRAATEMRRCHPSLGRDRARLCAVRTPSAARGR